MVKRNREVNGKNKKIGKEINIGIFKCFIILTVFVLNLMASPTVAHAAEQTQEQQTVAAEPEQEQEHQAATEPEKDNRISVQQDGSQAEPDATGVEISGTTMMYAVRNVNVRKEPNTTSEILGELEAGTNIFAVELTDEGWYRVVYGGETGYIRGDFLAVFGNMPEWSASEPEPELEPEPEQDGGTVEDGDATDSAGNAEDGTADNAAGSEAGDTKAASAQGQGGGKNNIFTILIIVALVIVIFAYAVIQIVKDNMNPDGGSEEDFEDEPDEED